MYIHTHAHIHTRIHLHLHIHLEGIHLILHELIPHSYYIMMSSHHQLHFCVSTDIYHKYRGLSMNPVLYCIFALHLCLFEPLLCHAEEKWWF